MIRIHSRGGAKRLRPASFILRLIPGSPLLQRVQHGLEAPAQVRQAVFHARGHFGIRPAVQEPVLFHVPQLRGQHLLGHMPNGFFSAPRTALSPASGRAGSEPSICPQSKPGSFPPDRPGAPLLTSVRSSSSPPSKVVSTPFGLYYMAASRTSSRFIDPGNLCQQGRKAGADTFVFFRQPADRILQVTTAQYCAYFFSGPTALYWKQELRRTAAAELETDRIIFRRSRT